MSGSELPLSYQPALADWIGRVESLVNNIAAYERLPRTSPLGSFHAAERKVAWDVLSLAGSYMRLHAIAMAELSLPCVRKCEEV